MIIHLSAVCGIKLVFLQKSCKLARREQVLFYVTYFDVCGKMEIYDVYQTGEWIGGGVELHLKLWDEDHNAFQICGKLIKKKGLLIDWTNLTKNVINEIYCLI